MDGFWHVRDLGSTNGTRVNGVACKESRLMPRDVLGLGKIRFQMDYPAADEGRRTSSIHATRETEFPKNAFPNRVGERGKTPGHTAPGPTAPQAGPSLGELVPCGGGETIPLRKAELIVGRHQSCDIHLPYSFVSGQHCRLKVVDGSWLVEDLRSRNGIRVDGVRCASSRLKPGSVLWIATLRFRVNYGQEEKEVGPEEVDFSQGLLEKAGLAHWKPPDQADRQRQRLIDD